LLLVDPPQGKEIAEHPSGNTLGITMKTVTLKIPKTLEAKIRRVLKERKESFSELARRALAREVEGSPSFADLAAPYRGMFSGPGDLSMREGYGSRDNRCEGSLTPRIQH
jgi:hypothetical protein